MFSGASAGRVRRDVEHGRGGREGRVRPRDDGQWRGDDGRSRVQVAETKICALGRDGRLGERKCVEVDVIGGASTPGRTGRPPIAKFGGDEMLGPNPVFNILSEPDTV